jgi:hypothetical protein
MWTMVARPAFSGGPAGVQQRPLAGQLLEPGQAAPNERHVPCTELFNWRTGWGVIHWR